MLDIVHTAKPQALGVCVVFDTVGLWDPPYLRNKNGGSISQYVLIDQLIAGYVTMVFSILQN